MPWPRLGFFSLNLLQLVFISMQHISESHLHHWVLIIFKLNLIMKPNVWGKKSALPQFYFNYPGKHFAAKTPSHRATMQIQTDFHLHNFFEVKCSGNLKAPNLQYVSVRVGRNIGMEKGKRWREHAALKAMSFNRLPSFLLILEQ